MIPPVSKRLEKRITETGGKAENGLPLFRVMRGSDRFTFIGGEWKHFDASGNETGSHVGVERVLKYPEAEHRYIFEMLLFPEYTEAEWEMLFTHGIGGQRVETLGPYPRNGEYELVRVIERVTVDRAGNATKREFVTLTESLCDALVLTAKMNRELTGKHKQEAARGRREKAQKETNAHQVAIIEELERPRWAREPHIIVPGAEKKTKGGIILVN